MDGAQEYRDVLLSAVDNYMADCDIVIESMNSIKSRICAYHEGCNKVQAAGSVAKLLGASAVALGVLYPPITIVGGISIIGGSVTNIGTKTARQARNR